MGTSNADKLMRWAGLSRNPDGGPGVTQLLGSLLGSENLQPSSLYQCDGGNQA